MNTIARRSCLLVAQQLRRQQRNLLTHSWLQFQRDEPDPPKPNEEYLENQKNELLPLNTFLKEQRSYESMVYRFMMLGADLSRPGESHIQFKPPPTHHSIIEELDMDYRDLDNGMERKKKSDSAAEDANRAADN